MTKPIALITGASRGIGRASALRLAQLGYDLILQYRNDEQAVATLVAEATELGATSHIVQADFGEPNAVDDLWTHITSALGQRTLDFTLLNAGVAPQSNPEQFSGRELAEVLQINTVAPYELAVKAATATTAPGGQLVFIGSGLTRYAFPSLTGYGMSKIALEYLTLNLAAILGERGITVNILAPGVVDTDMHVHWLRGNAEARAATEATSALGRIAAPEDIAEAVGLLASLKKQSITGQRIDVSMGTQL